MSVEENNVEAAVGNFVKGKTYEKGFKLNEFVDEKTVKVETLFKKMRRGNRIGEAVMDVTDFILPGNP